MRNSLYFRGRHGSNECPKFAVGTAVPASPAVAMPPIAPVVTGTVVAPAVATATSPVALDQLQSTAAASVENKKEHVQVDEVKAIWRAAGLLERTINIWHQVDPDGWWPRSGESRRGEPCQTVRGGKAAMRARRSWKRRMASRALILESAFLHADPALYRPAECEQNVS